MKKRLVCLALALILALTTAQSAFALEDLSTYASGNFNTAYPVYSGPGEHYFRANSGKATYGGGSARIYGIDGNWIMIGYGMTDGGYRIGYITKTAMNNLTNQKGTIRNLAFSNVTMYAMEKCYLTDDPIISNKSIYTVGKGQAVTALGTTGGWTYVELQGTSTKIRGFLPTRSLSYDPSATPTAKPAATTPPYSPPVVTAPPYSPPVSGSALLANLTHNCPNTGIMLPSYFSPYQTTYLLTVADWVSRVIFTPTAQDYTATIRVNNKVVQSGRESQVIQMTDKPQAVTISVVNGSESTTYTVYLQRRPSEKRTRVSSGYINNIYSSSGKWRIDADLVTVKYAGEDYYSGNRSTFTNSSTDRGVYDYVVNPNCSFYCGTKENCFRVYSIQDFKNYYTSYGILYTFVYIEDEIVAIFPYGIDY